MMMKLSKRSGVSSECEIEQLLCKSGAEPPQIKNTGTVCSLNFTSGYLSKRSETRKSLSNWAPIFTAELFSANKRSERNHMSRGRWVRFETWHINKMKYCSVLKSEKKTVVCSGMVGMEGYYAEWQQSNQQISDPLRWGMLASSNA